MITLNLITVIKRFPDHESCVKHLETVRWGDTPECAYCESQNVAPKREGGRIGRWNCHLCKSSFNVLAKTMFQGTKVDLQKWFLAISLVANARKSIASCQLARDLNLNQSTAWYMIHRIRAEMRRKNPNLLTRVSSKPMKRF